MLAAQINQVVLSLVPIKQEGVQVVSVSDLPSLVRDNPHAIVYLLWPEHRELISSLTPAKVYVIGDHPNDMNQLREAIKAGAEDYLDKRKFIEEQQEVVINEGIGNQNEEQMIRLSPKKPIQPIIQRQSVAQSQIVVSPVFQAQEVLESEEPVLPVTQKEEVPLNYARLDELHLRGIGGRQTLVVTSTKGGIGKTTVVMNAARLLHESKRGRVVLVDFMLPHGNISTRLKMKFSINVKTWESYMERGVNLTDQQILTNLVVKLPDGMYVLPSVNVGENCSPELLDYILSHLNKVFDFVVIDMGPERQDLLQRAMTTATKTILVVDYDLATIKDTQDYAVIWRNRQLSSEKINVVVNFEPLKKDRNTLTRDKCKEFLRVVDLNVIGFLPEVQGMRGIHNEGKVMVQQDMKNPFSQAMEEIIQKIVIDYQSPKKKKGFLSSLFSRS
ncbi:AAA_31 domain-containing protein [Brevibacillus sp. IT-7CA2]|uniref:AAA family ATPase n=1 Tax=Brevibacillus sp. IT-7CA2 TaxID=3026436 RepID=UPI0039E0C0CB